MRTHVPASVCKYIFKACGVSKFFRVSGLTADGKGGIYTCSSPVSIRPYSEWDPIQSRVEFETCAIWNAIERRKLNIFCHPTSCPDSTFSLSPPSLPLLSLFFSFPACGSPGKMDKLYIRKGKKYREKDQGSVEEREQIRNLFLFGDLVL